MHGGVANPPLRAAITEYSWWKPYLREEQLLQQYGYLLKEADCDSLQCLRGLDATELANASYHVHQSLLRGGYGYGSFWYGPYVDGNAIGDVPLKEFKAGHFTKVPPLIDRRQYEGYGFTNPN
jgi:carboxylesterase type B